MDYILNIETSTTVCSVSLSNKDKIISFKEINDGHTHAENLHVFIQDVLKQADIEPKQLKAISVSKGPGSYTGLRIGVSAAKGLAYALNIPLIAIDTLEIMTNAVLKTKKVDGFFCPMLDARRMEVYTAVYDKNLNKLMPVNALVIGENSIEPLENYGDLYFFGNGMQKCRQILEKISRSEFIENIYPSAQFMANLSWQKFSENKFENVAYFEPYYLKEFFTPVKKGDTNLPADR